MFDWQLRPALGQLPLREAIAPSDWESWKGAGASGMAVQEPLYVLVKGGIFVLRFVAPGFWGPEYDTEGVRKAHSWLLEVLSIG